MNEMIDNCAFSMQPLNSFLTEYKELNDEQNYRPVAVGRYGIRTRESIYSKELAKDYSKNKVIRKNTLTVGMGSVQMDIGVLTDDVVYSVSPAYHTYQISGINCDYLRFCLQARNMDMFLRYMKRGSRQGKSIDLNAWIKYKIPVYDESKQSEIVSCLQSVQRVIEQRQQELQKLDELIKARFVEMFGDLKTNSMKWPVVGFGECATIDTNMIHDFAGYENYPHIGIDSIEKETGRLYGYRTIAEDGVISGKYLFTPAHIIYSKIRPNLNKVALPDFEGLCSADAYPILVKQNVCTREYLGYTMRGRYFLDYILAFSDRTNLPKVNKTQVEGFRLPLPPIELQQQFTNFIKELDKSKFVVQKALDEAQLLFDSLMQKYFG